MLTMQPIQLDICPSPEYTLHWQETKDTLFRSMTFASTGMSTNTNLVSKKLKRARLTFKLAPIKVREPHLHACPHNCNQRD